MSKSIDLSTRKMYYVRMKKIMKKELVVATRFGDFLFTFESNAPEKGYTVTSTALHGFVTGGNSLAEAKRMAKEGAEFHFECVMLECRVPYSRPLQALSK